MYKLYSTLLTFLILAVTVVPCAGSGGDDFGPWSDMTPGVHSAAGRGSWGAEAAIFCLQVFSEYISPVDGDRCRMYPTCASYSVQAYRKHGFVIGTIMTADRLMHESEETETAPLIIKHGAGRFHDPVEANDFWWYKEK